MADNILSVSKTLSAAQINSIFATPITIVQSPGAGFAVVPLALTIVGNTTGHTPWAGGGSIELTQNAGTPMCATDPGVLTGATDALSYSLNTGISAFQLTDVEAQSIDITNETGAFTGGTGSTAQIFLVYELVKLT